MQKVSPRKIIITISIITALVLNIAIISVESHIYLTHWKLIIIFSISLFLVIYGVSSYLINKFFIDIINPIYKIIRSVKVMPITIVDEIEEPNFSNNLQQEVQDWAREKTKQIAQLRMMEKYRKEFLGDVSHELKTPIFTIQGYISTLIDGGIDDPNINMKYLLRTEKSIDRMISIVEDLLSISKFETNELILNKEVFDIKLLIREIIDMQADYAAKKNITLQLVTNNSYMVNADRKLLYQVLLNLIINSINYGRTNGKTDIFIHDMDKQVLIDISDNGIGIAKQDLPRLFERFYRVDKSRSKENGGTGLGLSICKHIVEAHQQTISVSSQDGFGSSFSFTLEKA